MGAPAREVTVAMFDGNTHQREMVRAALEVTTMPHMQAAACCEMSTDPRAAREQLAASHADVVIWDASPATPRACELLETLLLERVFVCCGLLVTTTNARQLRAFLGATAGGVAIIEKPYPVETLVRQLERLGALRQAH